MDYKIKLTCGKKLHRRLFWHYHIERHYDPFDSSHSAYGSITVKKLSPNLVEMMWFWCFFSRGSQVADGGWASAIFGRRLSGLHWRYILEWPENFSPKCILFVKTVVVFSLQRLFSVWTLLCAISEWIWNKGPFINNGDGKPGQRDGLEGVSQMSTLQHKHMYLSKLQLPLTVAHFLVRGFFRFIATKELNSGNCRHIFSRDNHSKKI